MVLNGFYFRFRLLNFSMKPKIRTSTTMPNWHSNFEITSYREYMGGQQTSLINLSNQL